MSADNGIYILKTKEGQYRVIHTQAIENIYDINDPNQLAPEQIINYYGKSKYTYEKNLARGIAFSIARELPVLEYGIREIVIDKTWDQILNEAKENGKEIKIAL